jgi:hypothetical protein
MSDTKPAAKKAATKTVSVQPEPAPAAPTAADETKAPAAAEPEATIVDAAPVDSTAIEPDTASTPEAVNVVEREKFVADLLNKIIPGNVAESWTARVIGAIDDGEPVTISDVNGAPVLEVHSGMRYQGHDWLLAFAERLGLDLKVNVNQMVLEKFPKA